MSDTRKLPPIETRFKPGQSGNPGGLAKGTRNKLNAAFLSALAKDFQDHGEAAIKACREDDPSVYVRVLAALLPKEVEVKRPLEDLDDAELIAAVRTLQSFLTAQDAAAGAGAPSEPTQTH